MSQKIRTELFLDDSALKIVLNAPKANVLDAEMMTEINALLDELQGRAELRLLCFEGEGTHFSFGASVEEHVGERARDMLAAFHGMFSRLAALAIPTAAVVRGRCLGGGMELACFCSRVFASESAVLGQPEIQLGVLAPVASLILPLRCGQAAADEVLLTGRSFEVHEAMRLGLVDHVSRDPAQAMLDWAQEHLAGKSASSLRYAQRASRWMYNRALRKRLPKLEKFYLDELMASHDANEGLAAFIDKRTPEWKNA